MANELAWICAAYRIRPAWLISKQGEMEQAGLDISQFHHPDLK
jgi:hypothetical protein